MIRTLILNTLTGIKAVLYFTALMPLLSSCQSGSKTGLSGSSSSVRHYPLPSRSFSVMDTGTTYQIGGYGSDLVYCNKDHTFWLLTDRGPNVDNQSGDGKIFPEPDFSPRIGIFSKDGDRFVLKHEIILKNQDNRPFTGLPIKDSPGQTGETAYDLYGKKIQSSASHGIDPEGLALLPDSTFWVSDEYGPFLMHFDRSGRCIDRLSPFDGSMPQHYQSRKPNRGLEGLCANPDGTYLYGIMQSPLMGEKEHIVPLFRYDLTDKDWTEFRYPLDTDSDGANALCWLSDSTLLVLERDGKFPDEHTPANKKVYKVCLSDRSPILQKTLVLDIVKAAPDYGHDKAEGIALIGDSILCVANDDDFGITSPTQPDNTIIEKNAPSGNRDFNELWFFRIK